MLYIVDVTYAKTGESIAELITNKIYTIKGLVVLLDRDLAEFGATVANFATVQNQGNYINGQSN